MWCEHIWCACGCASCKCQKKHVHIFKTQKSEQVNMVNTMYILYHILIWCTSTVWIKFYIGIDKSEYRVYIYIYHTYIFISIAYNISMTMISPLILQQNQLLQGLVLSLEPGPLNWWFFIEILMSCFEKTSPILRPYINWVYFTITGKKKTITNQGPPSFPEAQLAMQKGDASKSERLMKFHHLQSQHHDIMIMSLFPSQSLLPVQSVHWPMEGRPIKWGQFNMANKSSCFSPWKTHTQKTQLGILRTKTFGAS